MRPSNFCRDLAPKSTIRNVSALSCPHIVSPANRQRQQQQQHHRSARSSLVRPKLYNSLGEPRVGPKQRKMDARPPQICSGLLVSTGSPTRFFSARAYRRTGNPIFCALPGSHGRAEEKAQLACAGRKVGFFASSKALQAGILSSSISGTLLTVSACESWFGDDDGWLIGLWVGNVRARFGFCDWGVRESAASGLFYASGMQVTVQVCMDLIYVHHRSEQS